MYWFFEVQPGLEWLADSLAILWVGLAMSVIAWMKMWMAKLTFNTGEQAIRRSWKGVLNWVVQRAV